MQSPYLPGNTATAACVPQKHTKLPRNGEVTHHLGVRYLDPVQLVTNSTKGGALRCYSGSHGVRIPTFAQARSGVTARHRVLRSRPRLYQGNGTSEGLTMTADILSKTISPLSGLLGKDQKPNRQDNTAPFVTEKQVDEWELGAKDALREDILSSYIPVSDGELARIFNKDSGRQDDLSESVETETMPLLREATEIPTLETPVREPETPAETELPTAEKTLGVFSDSRIYSAMIRQELKRHDVTIKHFNHPASLRPERFDFFDSIDAWMVFLSDEYNGDFLDTFLERYGDKPTLFLVEKSQRYRTSRNIDQFLTGNGLSQGPTD